MKKIIIGFFAIALASSSQAAWLWWQVDSSKTMANTGATYEFGTGKDYNAGTIYAKNGSESKALSVADAQGVTISGATMVGDTAKYAINLSQLGDVSLSSYSFYVEYVNYDSDKTTQIAIGDAVQYSNLTSYITDELSTTPPVYVWHGGTMNAPEPTSAMLMLLGVAGLALRRKQRKLA